MAYIGYSESTTTFTKLLVDEFGNDYDGDSYLLYIDKIKEYLNDEINEKDFLEFLDNSKFCVFELDNLLKETHDIIGENIGYKQKINKLVVENIEQDSLNNRAISIKSISILFDDFVDIYNDNIFDYEGFYISVFGIFVNFSQEKFMEFINDIIKYNSLTFDDFYFLINFLRDIVEFKHLKNYTKEFILYCEDYLDVEDDSAEHISILMFLAFKLNRTIIEIMKSPENDFWMKDKEFILATLKLFSNYCREYNSVFIEQIDDKNEKFIENRDIVYGLLKYLTKIPVNDMDCEVILDIYSRLMFDYIEYSSVEKVTSIVKYLVSPIFKFDHMEEIMLLNNIDRIINTLSFCFVSKINYVDLFRKRYEEYGFDLAVCTYLLRLILSEDIYNKKKYISILLNIPGIISNFKNGNDLIYTYLVWISKDLLHDREYRYELSLILEILRTSIDSTKFSQMYQLVRNIISNLNSPITYAFEGESFYKKILEGEKEIYKDSLVTEYFYAKNVFLFTRNSDIENEKIKLIDKLKEYFLFPNSKNRNAYYEFLINTKYFEIYKFEIIDSLSRENINSEILKIECDFLIYDSPHINSFKLGLVLSIVVENENYIEVYKNTLFKMTCGDIFRELNYKFRFVDEEYILSSHKSYTFIIKWSMYRDLLYSNEEISEINNRINNIRNMIFRCINNYDKKLDSYCFLYIIIFADHSDSKDIYNGVNITTLKLRTIMELVEEDRSGEILDDEYIYLIFEKGIKDYVKSFISLTQFEVLDEIYTIIEKKFVRIDKNIQHKEIENNESSLDDLNLMCFKNKYREILKYINKVLKSSEANEYYENIFINQDLTTLVSILNNERRFYNETVELFHIYINTLDFLSLNEICKKSSKNSFIAKIFVKLLSEYPNVIKETLEEPEKLELYKEILKYTV